LTKRPGNIPLAAGTPALAALFEDVLGELPCTDTILPDRSASPRPTRARGRGAASRGSHARQGAHVPPGRATQAARSRQETREGSCPGAGARRHLSVFRSRGGDAANGRQQEEAATLTPS